MSLSNKRCSLAFLLVLFAFTAEARANDAAASKSSGGIILTREARISMEKERLNISEKRITVEYEFLNDTNQDITTEVAFPVPPYEAGEWYSAAGMRVFDDFHVWINGKEIPYDTEAKAFLGNKDITDTLNRYHVDVATEGHLAETTATGPQFNDINRLTKSQKEELNRIGVSSDFSYAAGWSVHKTYHWKQTFPAHTILHVRHEYSPAVGHAFIRSVIFDPAEQQKEKAEGKPADEYDPDYRELDRACVAPSLQRSIVSKLTKGGRLPLADAAGDAVPGAWVDYILTTANSWKTPNQGF